MKSNSSRCEFPLESAESNYAILRIALAQFGKPPASLSAGEHQEVLHQANREMAIGKRVLEAKEAGEVVVPEPVVIQAINVLAQRFDNEAEFDSALEANGLDRNSLYQALHHELKVEAVLEKIIAEKAAVNDTELEIYYLQHLEKFQLPETRTARHILITINDEYEENRREKALQRIGELRDMLLQGEEFPALAQRHSECPTAMQDGLLGRIRQGQLYPELDEVLFDMEQGEISGVVESPIGLHLLLCEWIHAAERRSFEEVKEQLREHTEKRNRTRLLRDWLRQAP